MKKLKGVLIFVSLMVLQGCAPQGQRKIFVAHLHGNAMPEEQLARLRANGVQMAAVSTSWAQQKTYQSNEALRILHGLFVPCRNGKVLYSLPRCFEDGGQWPDIDWVEQQIRERKIDFIGEVLTQYHGISMSDTLMYPYYALAQKYGLPVGIHTGSAGPDHGCPNFREEMGNPLLLQDALRKFPKLKVWLMHGGGPYAKAFMEMMRTYPGLYADISVLNNPKIIPPEHFALAMGEFIKAGLEDRLLFGSDNADIKTTVDAVEQLGFLTDEQKGKIFYGNARQFFGL